MAGSKLRSSSSFLPTLLLSSLILILFLLSSASFAPIFLLRNPPTHFGWALFLVSSLTLLSSLLGFYSQLTRCFFVTHLSLLLSSMVGQALGFLALFLKESRSLDLLGSRRSPRETRFLFKTEECFLMGMFLTQSLVLMLSCVLQSCWVGKYEGMELEKEEMARKRSRRMVRVQEESMANVAMMGEVKSRELDEKMKSKY